MNNRSERPLGTWKKLTFGKNVGNDRGQFARLNLLHIALREGHYFRTFGDNGALLFADDIDISICLLGAHGLCSPCDHEKNKLAGIDPVFSFLTILS